MLGCVRDELCDELCEKGEEATEERRRRRRQRDAEQKKTHSDVGKKFKQAIGIMTRAAGDSQGDELRTLVSR